MVDEKNKIQSPVDLILLEGLILLVVYSIINRLIVKIPDVVAYPWMIISCICMLIGSYRTGKKLGGFFRK